MRHWRSWVAVWALAFALVAPTAAFASYTPPYWQNNPGTYQGTWWVLTDAQKQQWWAQHHTGQVMRFEQLQAYQRDATAAYMRWKAGTGTFEAWQRAVDATTQYAKTSQMAQSSGKTTTQVLDAVVKSVPAARQSGLKAWGSRVFGSATTVMNGLALSSLYWTAAQSVPEAGWYHADGSLCTEHNRFQCPESEHYVPTTEHLRDFIVEGVEVSVEDTAQAAPAPPPPDGYYDITGAFAGKPVPWVTHRDSGVVMDEAEAALVNALLFDQGTRLRVVSTVPLGDFTYQDLGTFFKWRYKASGRAHVYDPADGWLSGGFLFSEWSVADLRQLGGGVCMPSAGGFGYGLVEAVGERQTYGPGVEETFTVPPMVFPSGSGGVAVVKVSDPPGGWSPDPTLGEIVDQVSEPSPDAVPAPVREAVEDVFPDQPIVAPSDPPAPDTGPSRDWLDSLIEPLLGILSGIDIFWPFRFMAGWG